MHELSQFGGKDPCSCIIKNPRKSSDEKLRGNSLCERLVIPDKSCVRTKNVRNCKMLAGIMMVILDFTGR